MFSEFQEILKAIPIIGSFIVSFFKDTFEFIKLIFRIVGQTGTIFAFLPQYILTLASVSLAVIIFLRVLNRV